MMSQMIYQMLVAVGGAVLLVLLWVGVQTLAQRQHGNQHLEDAGDRNHAYCPDHDPDGAHGPPSKSARAAGCAACAQSMACGIQPKKAG